VIGAKVFVRRGTDRDSRAASIEEAEHARIIKDEHDEIEIIKDSAYRRIADILDGNVAGANLVDDRQRVLLNKGDAISHEVLTGIPRRHWKLITVKDGSNGARDKVLRILNDVDEQVARIQEYAREKVEKLQRGDDLPPGVIKQVKIYVAIKRKLQVGDKMAGRHGNKGVVSKILPMEDLPYLQDGTPVDIVLNPLGVPSRMNVGQVLETHLGWAALGAGRRLNEMVTRYLDPESMPDEVFTDIKARLSRIYHRPEQHEIIDGLDKTNLAKMIHDIRNGVHVAVPVFDGAKESQIKELLHEAGLPETGQMILFDGRTGEPFDEDVTVGVMYILKLHHLVDDKIHARSIGPYSLVTQQPLGGKAQFGGQRLGEMEVWAMEAYGAAYSLQEFLTVKSDDVQGRTRMYESIVRGEMKLDAGLPESFNVLIKELHSLCLNVELLENVA
jgi:DNA-directed RNA polymerase subunit beta